MFRRKFSFLLVALIVALITGTLDVNTPVQAGPGDALRKYPVIPAIRGGVLSKARSLFRLGQRIGNRKNVFSKIGDSNTAFTYFLTPIGTGGLHLGGYGDLQGAADFFIPEVARTHNSFANESLAAWGGWTTNELLNTNSGIPGCEPGETPVECELRITRPSIALIMIGTNELPGGDVRGFKNRLTKIVTLVERKGVIPVLSTIPYRLDSDVATNNTEAFNLAIVQVARARGVALWNYWLAMDGLPNHGISTDSVHPSVPPDNNTAVFDEFHLAYGFTMRNLNALQILNAFLPVVNR